MVHPTIWNVKSVHNRSLRRPTRPRQGEIRSKIWGELALGTRPRQTLRTGRVRRRARIDPLPLTTRGHDPPAESSISRILNHAGLVISEPTKRPKSSYVHLQVDGPNETRQSDFTHSGSAGGTDGEPATEKRSGNPSQTPAETTGPKNSNPEGSGHIMGRPNDKYQRRPETSHCGE